MFFQWALPLPSLPRPSSNTPLGYFHFPGPPLLLGNFFKILRIWELTWDLGNLPIKQSWEFSLSVMFLQSLLIGFTCLLASLHRATRFLCIGLWHSHVTHCAAWMICGKSQCRPTRWSKKHGTKFLSSFPQFCSCTTIVSGLLYYLDFYYFY